MASSAERADDVELVRGAVENWTRGRRDAVLQTLTEDVEVLVPPELGSAGSFRGKSAFLDWTRSWEEAWSQFDMEIERIEPVGERHVIATIRSRGTGMGSGIEVENLVAWVFETWEGLCTFLSLQASQADALELVRSRERS